MVQTEILMEAITNLSEKVEWPWLQGFIESYQLELGRKTSPFTGEHGIPFQIWGIVVHDDKSATVYMIEDAGLPPLIEQEIPYTDFVLPKFEMYCIGDVVLLKSEY